MSSTTVVATISTVLTASSLLLPSAAVQIFNHGPNIKNAAAHRDEKLFTDVTDHAFPPEWYEWSHVGRARNYMGTPVFPDWNNDGVLDFFYHNHFQNNPATEWDFGVSRGTNKANESMAPWYDSVGEKHLICTEELGSEYRKDSMDTHSTAILDIDRDGVIDMYISVGGGQGFDSGKEKNSVLMWGEESALSAIPDFRGGRDAAEKAGLDNENSRGRFTYFADLNKDGLLDVIFSNDVRMDQQNRYGYVMYNKGDRTFEADHTLAEYAMAMMLHDADGDGHADELVVQRRNCLPDTEAVDDWAKEVHNIPPVTDERRKFCESRPEGTAAIYVYNFTEQKMQQISPARSTSEGGEFTMAWSMQSGDFDSDGKADLVVLHETSLKFFYSSGRSEGRSEDSLPLGEPTKEKSWTQKECIGRALRVADFDLDGREELLIMCAQPGMHRLYRHGPSDSAGNFEWMLVGDSVGDLASTTLPPVQQLHLEHTCRHHNQDGMREYVAKLCQHFWRFEKMPQTAAYGVATADWNNDGFVDIALSHDVGSMMLLKNNYAELPSTKANRFIAVKLKGTVSNEYGIGATVILKARSMGPNTNATTWQLREVSTASHETDWWGSKDDRIIFGLGAAGIPESITVRWPGGPRGGRQIQLIEDESDLAAYVNDMKSLKVIYEPYVPE